MIITTSDLEKMKPTYRVMLHGGVKHLEVMEFKAWEPEELPTQISIPCRTKRRTYVDTTYYKHISRDGSVCYCTYDLLP